MMKAIALSTCLCLTVALNAASVIAQEPFFEGLGWYTRKITTSSPDAQKYFNQGLNFYFGFNHDEAIRSFQAAAAIDPDSAMAHWGIAHSVHMPSHIDIRLGHWNEAITANLKAVAADDRYRKIVGQPKGLMTLYAAHDQHMLAYAAMMAGRRDLAIEHIHAMADGIPPEVVKEYPMFSQAFIARI